jgi:hypothetical protein
MPDLKEVLEITRGFPVLLGQVYLDHWKKITKEAEPVNRPPLPKSPQVVVPDPSSKTIRYNAAWPVSIAFATYVGSSALE